MPIKQIPSSRVEIGMYISHLDRPWTETPFLFQGFMVKTQKEIDELNRVANNVYIMEPDEEIEIKHQSTSQLESTRSSGLNTAGSLPRLTVPSGRMTSPETLAVSGTCFTSTMVL